MDAILSKRLDDARKPNDPDQIDLRLKVVDAVSGAIEVIVDDQAEPYMLRPLAELYGPGSSETVDPKSARFTPLFLSVEEEIVRFDNSQWQLSDGEVTLALEHLSMNPEAHSADSLTQHIQCALRLNLSLNNYSRQEVRQVVRKIQKSVARHYEGGRGRGYINFIHQFFGACDDRRSVP